ncbi:MAG: hypothetical protein JRI94_16505 [Deltaproteobacteria bacterium]|nr:hypothetical protein [Deltaproteobacteria bacterium]MBW2115439.1 hypothetical protein [Deltaproteobacteria bacterium]
MDGSNQKTYKDRLEKLENLITKEFISNRFEVQFEPVISVAFDRQRKKNERNPRIEFNTDDEEFMTDPDSNVDEVFQQSVSLAKKILNDPPMKNRILQGQILLTDDGAIFNKRKI